MDHVITGELFKALIANAVTTPLKAGGFRKSGTSYHRRRGKCVQVINIQVSGSSTHDVLMFYVNVGIAFDAVCDLAELPILDRPKEHECDDRGTRDRLGQLIGGEPATWTIGLGQSPEEISAHLLACISRLQSELESIDGVAAYRNHRWFERFRPAKTNAQILYLLGDYDGAWHEVQALAKLFFDRLNANRTEWWIEQLHFTELKSRKAESAQ